MTTTSYPPELPESKPDPRIFSAEGQAFLVGETIFLRGLEEEDAVRASAWPDSPYPINAGRAEDLIKEATGNATPGQMQLVACRRSDGMPVGSLTSRRYPENDPTTRVTLHSDPAVPGHDAIQAEMLGLMHGWAFGEAEWPVIQLAITDDQTWLRETAGSLRMRLDVRHRQARWRDGTWRDFLLYTDYHPAWLERLGDPGSGIDHALPPDDPSRWRPRRQPTFGEVTGDPPANAVMIGPRVYLRPLEIADAAGMVASQRQEPDTFMNEGRHPTSALSVRQQIRNDARSDPPGADRFAVCLRETGQHIGCNGVYAIDRIHRTAGTESNFHEASARNQGYGTEAKHLLLAYAFDRLGLHSVYSWVWGPNLRSAAALRRQGYREAGRVFWAGTKDGAYTHAFNFDFLASEWREMTARAREHG